MKSIRVGAREIGGGAPCFIAAEIGINHNGDLALAHRTIDAAADAGAHGVKFQNYRTEDFLSDRSLTHTYVSRGTSVTEPQFDMFKRYELSRPALAELKDHCDRRGVVFFSTPTSPQGVDDLVAVGTRLLKNGSDYLSNLVLVRAMATSGLPTVLSTGMATIAEIDESVRAFREAGGVDLMLLVCTSSYPTPPDEVHLRRLEALRLAFGTSIGFSDHTEGYAAAIAAVALGACFVEKHFTLDRDLPGPDHSFSSDPAELRSLVEGIRVAERALGDATIGPTSSEAHGRKDYRLSCVTARPLTRGDVLTEADVAFRRPGTGLPPAAASWIVGRRIAHDMTAGQTFEPGDFA
jgi:N,N'-diacetyllegionaminate synthase